MNMIDPLNRNESTEENANEITWNTSHSPESNDNGWCCTCGASNKASEQNCHACGRSKELLIATLNADVLDVDLAEQLEKRSTEEQERLECEEQEQEILNAERKKKKKKKRIKIGIIIMISVLILVGVGYIGTIYAKRYVQYQNACEALDKEEYLTAYRNFTELNDFMESDEKLTECVYSWVDYVLSSGDKSNAYTLSDNVSLNTKFYRKVYNRILEEIECHPFYTDWLNKETADVIYILLKMLPSSYKNTKDLCEFIQTFSEECYWPYEYIRNNKSMIENFWEFDFIQDYVISDDAILYFLEDYWSTPDESYYLHFFENDENGTTSSISNLPEVDKPDGTAYFDIVNLNYIFTSENNVEFAKVYRFTVIDFYTIEVYCYENHRTYTLYRDNY